MAVGTPPPVEVGVSLPPITPLCGPNLGGLAGCVRLYPVSNVVSLPPIAAGSYVGSLVLVDAYNYMDVWFPYGGARFAEPEDDSEQGSFYKPKLQLTVPKDDPDLAAALRRLRHHRYFVALYLDGNGHTKLVGTVETPLRFLSALDTGEKGGDRNSYALSFAGETEDAAGFYLNFVAGTPATRRAFSSGFSFGFA